MLWHTQVKMRVPLLSRDDALLEIAGHRMYPRYRPIGKYARSNSIFNRKCANFDFQQYTTTALLLYYCNNVLIIIILSTQNNNKKTINSTWESLIRLI